MGMICLYQLLHPLPNDKFLDWSKLKAFVDEKINATQKWNFLGGNGRKHCGKRGKCWLPAFSPFPTMFSKAFIFRVVKSLDCVVELNGYFRGKKIHMVTVVVFQYNPILKIPGGIELWKTFS